MKKFTFFATTLIVVLLIMRHYGSPDKSLISQTVDKKMHRDSDPASDFTTLVNQTTNTEAALSSVHTLQRSDRCYNQRLNVNFICRPEWKIILEDDQLSLLLTEDQSAVMTVLKIDRPFISLYQLDTETILSIGNYNGNFSREDTTFAGKNAFKIKAFTNTEPQSRLLDYYVMNNENLYRISFRVEPKEHWDEHKFLIRELSDGFAFGKPEPR